MLFVFRHSPYASSHAREGIEALLAALAFNQNPKALFMDDGIYQLIKNQDEEMIKQDEDTKKMIANREPGEYRLPRKHRKYDYSDFLEVGSLSWSLMIALYFLALHDDIKNTCSTFEFFF